MGSQLDIIIDRGKFRIALSFKEELVLLSVWNTELCPADIQQSINEASRGIYHLPISSIHTLTKRLVKKGLLDTRLVNGDKRNKRKKNYYRLSNLGAYKVKDIQEIRVKLMKWKGMG